MEYLKLGTITDSFGLDGTLKIYSTTNMGAKRYQKGSKVFLHEVDSEEYFEYTVLTYRHNGLFDFVKLENIDTKEDAFAKKGQEICVIKNREDLQDNEYFYSDLKGCAILNKNGEKLGIVKEIEEFPAQLTLRVKRDNKPDFFVPFIEQFILEIDIEKKTIKIEVIEGLL